MKLNLKHCNEMNRSGEKCCILILHALGFLSCQKQVVYYFTINRSPVPKSILEDGILQTQRNNMFERNNNIVTNHLQKRIIGNLILFIDIQKWCSGDSTLSNITTILSHDAYLCISELPTLVVVLEQIKKDPRVL